MTVAVAMIVSTSSTEIVAVRLHPHSGPIASTIASTNAVACTENPIQVSGKDKMQTPSTESKKNPGAFIRISRDMPTGLQSPDSREYTRGCNTKLAFHVLVGESVHPGVDDRSVRIYKRCAAAGALGACKTHLCTGNGGDGAGGHATCGRVRPAAYLTERVRLRHRLRHCQGNLPGCDRNLHSAGIAFTCQCLDQKTCTFRTRWSQVASITGFLQENHTPTL